MQYTCHSGGCPGSDMIWETECLKYGIKTISYSFYNHKHEGQNPRILSVEELEEGYRMCRIADKTLKRNFENIEYLYVKNLLARNWFQVKNADAVFAIIKGFITNHTVEGGTGWAVQMAIDCDKPVFVYEQHPMCNGWRRYMPIVGFESLRGEIPLLTKNFAGIGTREISRTGINGIKKILEYNFKSDNAETPSSKV